jgi:hypothetical protein
MPYAMELGRKPHPFTGKPGMLKVYYDWDDSPIPNSSYICVLDVEFDGESIYDHLTDEAISRVTAIIGRVMMRRPPTPEDRATNDAEMAEHRAADPVHALIKSGNIEALAEYTKHQGDDVTVEVFSLGQQNNPSTLH